MFILPPPPKYPMYTSGVLLNGTRSELQANIEATNTLTTLGPDQSFTAPEGVYDAKDCLSVATPMPHPSDPPPAVINPLAPTTFHPSTHSSGVKLSFMSLHYNPPPGTVEYQQQLLRKGNLAMPASVGTPITQVSTRPVKASSSSSAFSPSKTFGSSWTSSFFTNSSNRRTSMALTEETSISGISDDTTVSAPASEATTGVVKVPTSDDGSTYEPGSVNGNESHAASSVSVSTSAMPFPNRKKGLVSSLSIGSTSKESSSVGSNTPQFPENSNEKGLVQPGDFLAPPSSFGDTLTLPPDTIGGVLGPLAICIPIEAPKETKRKKPKTSLTKNNSSFISRTIVAENLSKKLAERGADELFFWVNIGRSFHWFDASPAAVTADTKKDPLSKILFTKSHPLCHDVNQYTRASNNIDIVLGMSSGDAIWLDASSNRYNRINKNGDIIRSAIKDIKWVPGSSNYFVSIHANGSLIIFDKDREDGGFASGGGLSHQDLRSTETFRIVKSLYSTPNSSNGNSSNPANANKHNPVAMYKLSNQPLTSVIFSPDRQTLVVTSADGFMRFLNLDTEVVTDIFPSYYDGILCAAFSPDGKYLATGGQDDLVTVWSMKRKTIIARGYGHQSWVRKVAFDNWNCDGFSYRVGSVGEDGNLILWDFSPKTLSRPKTAATTTTTSTGGNKCDSQQGVAGVSNGGGNLDQASYHRRTLSATPSIVSAKSGNTVAPSVYLRQQQQNRIQQQRSDDSEKSPLTNGNGITKDQQLQLQQQIHQHPFNETSVLHPFVSHAGTPTIPPVVLKSIKTSDGESESLSDIVFLANMVVVAGKDGRIWTWARPN